MQAVGAVLFFFIASQTKVDSPEHDATAHACMPTKQEIIEHRHSGKLSKILKGAGDANTRHLVCFEAQEIAPIKCHSSRNWLVDTRKHVEEGCFSRAVRTNHREQLSRLHLERDIRQRFDPGKAYRNSLDGEQG